MGSTKVFDIFMTGPGGKLARSAGIVKEFGFRIGSLLCGVVRHATVIYNLIPLFHVL